jgi:hypothetical protein
MSQRRLRLLLVDDEAAARNLGRMVEWMQAEGLIEAVSLSTLEELVSTMGITYDSERGAFSGDMLPFNYDVVFLDWRLNRTSAMISTLSAFAFIPQMRSRYVWSTSGEETEIVAYSKVWEAEVCKSLEGYLLGLQLRKRLATPEAEELEDVLFRKGMNIVGQMMMDRVRGVLTAVTTVQDDELSIYPGVTMTCFALFPMLAFYQNRRNDGALEDWKQRISTELQMVLLRFSSLYAYAQRPRFIALTHYPVSVDGTHGHSAYTAKELCELLDAELAELEKEHAEEEAASRCELPASAKEFITGELRAFRALLRNDGHTQASLDAAVGGKRASLKSGLRFRYSNTGDGYALLSDIAPVEPPANGAKWCSYVYVRAMSGFVGNLQGQLKGDGRLDRIDIDEERRVSIWHFTQRELVKDLRVIRSSGKWEAIWKFAEEYGELCVCVTETDESGDTASTWKTADLQPVDCPAGAERSTFVLVLPVWELA